jgi:hypothetical protein
MRMRLRVLFLIVAITLPHQAPITPVPAQGITPLLHDRLHDLDLIALARRLVSSMQRLHDMVRARVAVHAGAGTALLSRAA